MIWACGIFITLWYIQWYDGVWLDRVELHLQWTRQRQGCFSWMQGCSQEFVGCMQEFCFLLIRRKKERKKEERIMKIRNDCISDYTQMLISVHGGNTPATVLDISAMAVGIWRSLDQKWYNMYVSPTTQPPTRPPLSYLTAVRMPRNESSTCDSDFDLVWTQLLERWFQKLSRHPVSWCWFICLPGQMIKWITYVTSEYIKVPAFWQTELLQV